MIKSHFDELYDIVIPLSNESLFEHWELRIALRSIERYAEKCGNIYVVSDNPPSWLRNVKTVNFPDRHRHNKDANIIDKLLAVTAMEELSEKFLFWSDDQTALQKFRCSALYPVHNPRNQMAFHGKKVWHRRMLKTFEYLDQQGCKLNWNWDSHTPQPMNKALFKRLMGSVNYVPEPGFCINTLYFGLQNTKPLLPQHLIKVTIEQAHKLKTLPENKLFIGYNDRGLQGNLKQLLQERFPLPSRFEA